MRNKDEWKKVGIVEGAVTIPLKHVNERAHELKGIPNIVINCKSGMRARFAQSILASRNVESIVLAESKALSIFRGLRFIENRLQHVTLRKKVNPLIYKPESYLLV